jgi:spore coat protein U-like protein
MNQRGHQGARFRRACTLAIAVGAWLFAAPAFPACQITSVSDVVFGNYDVFSTMPNNNGVGSLSINCKGGSTATVKLSTGLSNTFATRTLRNGPQVIAYNLYTSIARNIVWGDGSGGTSVMSVRRNNAAILNVFGSIPAGQDAMVGTYTDTIVVTINF